MSLVRIVFHWWFKNTGRSHCSGCLHWTISTCRLPDNSSLYTAELWTMFLVLKPMFLVLKPVYCSEEKSFLILSDLLSSLQAIFNLKYDHPVLVQILDAYMELTRDGRKTAFVWDPGHVGIRGNSAAVCCYRCIRWRHLRWVHPLLRLKASINKYLSELWQLEWDEFP